MLHCIIPIGPGPAIGIPSAFTPREKRQGAFAIIRPVPNVHFAAPRQTAPDGLPLSDTKPRYGKSASPRGQPRLQAAASRTDPTKTEWRRRIMSNRIDLLKIAQEEQNGDLFKYLDSIFKRSKVQPRGISDAVIWEGGST